ncbi:alpha/beta hydrolase [Pseudothauera nasutitermitis]|uniref:Alpha/beta hydrolase n=1 Tax=Pseudothauera nasutitermitis TaxID=2565930 RepID=A0A4S4B5A1_9RHOO|nr:alpha/beta hydrolase [Pseudothauera nasutitermitis]THF66147.1 alpha/beta hydrolase [Pseudothauera nasutitermitis]
MKLRHSLISIPTAQTWLVALLCHAPDVRALAVILRPFSVPEEQEREDETSCALQASGHATLTLDLLTPHEESRDPDMRFAVSQLALRAEGVREWIAHQPGLGKLPVGLVASGTASAAAIRAAARASEDYQALACQGGRPDLAGVKPLGMLRVPTLIVAGGQDPGLPMLRQSYEHIGCERDWQELADCDDSFASPAAQTAFARLADDWLTSHYEAEALPAASDAP